MGIGVAVPLGDRAAEDRQGVDVPLQRIAGVADDPLLQRQDDRDEDCGRGENHHDDRHGRPHRAGVDLAGEFVADLVKAKEACRLPFGLNRDGQEHVKAAVRSKILVVLTCGVGDPLLESRHQGGRKVGSPDFDGRLPGSLQTGDQELTRSAGSVSTPLLQRVGQVSGLVGGEVNHEGIEAAGLQPVGHGARERRDQEATDHQSED